MTRKGLLIVLAAAFMSGVTAYAHHSQNAQYDTSKKLSIEATLLTFQFRNPHTFLQVEALDPVTGQKERWSVEWGGAGQLGTQGVTRTTLKYGDVVILTANPSRTPNDHKLHMLTLKRNSDGFGWGNRPGEVTD